MIQLNAIRLSDPDAERVRQSHALAIKEIQAAPAVAAQIIQNVEIVSAGGIANVSHGLGRSPRMVVISAPRYRQSEIASVNAAGTVYDRGAFDFSGNPIDRSHSIQLVAVGFSTGSITITVDVTVF